ncbi:MAG: prefoldin subunit [Candidatus Parvarchaeum sp.]
MDMNEDEFEETRQRLQAETTQKQTLQLQYNEFKRTIDEVEKTQEGSDLFQLSGQILIKKDKNEILKDLKDKLEIIEFRLKASSKSIDELTNKLQSMQDKAKKTQ